MTNPPDMPNDTTPTPRRGAGQEARRSAGAAIVVTGAGGGIGLAVVQRLRRDGWTVVATDLNAAALAAVTTEFADDPKVRTLAMDVTSASAIERVATQLREAKVAVAGLVNVAGVLQDVLPLLKMDAAAHHRVWDVNYFGAQQCLHGFVPAMVEGGGGAVVNITSINEMRPLPLHAYAPAKVALGALTQLAAGEFGPLGVRVNAVAPGFTLTPVFRDKIASGKRDAGVLEANASLGRLVETDEVAAAVSFLLSDESSAITGASLPVDCGWLVASHWMNFRALSQAG
jgi:NAD(P)-dependent dehydrogenase (short-subunit alcohol dehydrogenase family)